MQAFHFIKTTAKNNVSHKTVLFLHGWGGSTDSFLFAQNQASYTYDTINLDFYGFGLSPVPAKTMDTFLYALAVYEFLKSQNIGKVSIVAHSFGCRIATLLATIFDLQIEKLVLCNAAGIQKRRSLWYYAKVYAYKICRWLVKKQWIHPMNLAWFGSKDYKALPAPMKASFVKIVNQNLVDFLPKIACPTLLVWGKKDTTTPYALAKIYHQKIPNNRLLTFPNGGHFCYLQFAPQFHNAFLQFLKEGDGL